MISKSPRLDLVIPGLLGPMPRHDGHVELRLPLLEKLLARSEPASVGAEGFVSSLFTLFDYSSNPQIDFPEGAVNLLGQGGQAGSSCWMRADPVHLRADRDRLLLFHGVELALTDEESDRIRAEFNAHFAEDGLHLITPSADRWYLELEECPELSTHPVIDVAGRHIEIFLPQGVDAPVWRHRLNEMQMLLFQSEVNQHRESNRQLSVNGIWLSGVGRLPDPIRCHWDRVYSEDPTALGLAKLANVECLSTTDNLPQAWNRSGNSLMVTTELLSPLLVGDLEHWIRQLQSLESDLAPLAKAMGRLGSGELWLHPCNGRSYRLTPVLLRKFWKRRQAFSCYLG
jgi:hypothetical protein